MAGITFKHVVKSYDGDVTVIPDLNLEIKDKEMYDLKHELISVQIKCENAEKNLDRVKKENNNLQMKIVKLETEIKNSKGRN